MAQNRSSAVMAQRQADARAAEEEDFPGQATLDDFPTQPWGTRALLEHLIAHDGQGNIFREMSVAEPAANRGFMVKPLEEYFGKVWPSDVRDYGVGFPQHDFLMPYEPPSWPATGSRPDWIVTNPPYRLGHEFIDRALELALLGVAMLVRTAFLEGGDRYRDLYSVRPPTMVAQFVERLPMRRGRCTLFVVDDDGQKKKASTASSYAWLIWRRAGDGTWIVRPGHTDLTWIKPCRAHLERVSDYPAETHDLTEVPLAVQSAGGG